MPERIHEKISAYFGEVVGDPDHRYRSWEHCYRFFRDAMPSGIAVQRQSAALQLGFYLASWGHVSRLSVSSSARVHDPPRGC